MKFVHMVQMHYEPFSLLKIWTFLLDGQYKLSAISYFFFFFVNDEWAMPRALKIAFYDLTNM